MRNRMVPMFDPDRSRRTLALVLALTVSLLVPGCVETVKDQLEEGDGVGQAQLDTNLAVAISFTNATDALDGAGLALDAVEARPADGGAGTALELPSNDTRLGATGQTSLEATGQLRAGSYDQLRLTGTAHLPADPEGDPDPSGNASGNASTSDEGDQAETVPVEIPIQLRFTIDEGALTEIELVLDAGASFTEDGFAASVARATVSQDGQQVEQLDDVPVGDGVDADGQGEPGQPAGPPPKARLTVTGPDGDVAYEPGLRVEDGVFVNGNKTAYAPGETIRFHGNESDAVKQGAEIERYAWDFDDGTTANGSAVSHAYEAQGVFEVRLTVTDSAGTQASHMVRLLVLQANWTTTLLNTSFEEGAEGWTTSSNGETTWALDGPGQNESETSWHVGHHLSHTFGTPVQGDSPGYTSGAEATLLSPNITIPANWSAAGVSFHLGGASESGFDVLTVSWATANGTTGKIGTFSGSHGWFQVNETSTLSAAAGQQVQLNFTFTSDALFEQGDGWYLDDLVIGGVDLPVHNPDLVKQAPKR